MELRQCRKHRAEWACVRAFSTLWLVPQALSTAPSPHREQEGPKGSTAVDARGNEKCLVRKLYSVNPSALYLYLLIFHNILIKSSWWETIWGKPRKEGWIATDVFSAFAGNYEIEQIFAGRSWKGISKEKSVLKSSNSFITQSKYAMLCSARVIPEFCSSPLGHRLWFNTVNKHDIVLIAISQMGILPFFLIYLFHVLAQIHISANVKSKWETRHCLHHRIAAWKQDTEILLRLDHFLKLLIFYQNQTFRK